MEHWNFLVLSSYYIFVDKKCQIFISFIFLNFACIANAILAWHVFFSLKVYDIEDPLTG